MITTKSMWLPEDDGSVMGWASRFVEADFSEDKHYFVQAVGNHPGSERWPSRSNRFQFQDPDSPEAMDRWAARCTAEIARDYPPLPMKDRRQTWVVLKCLRSQSLNGRKARLLAQDPKTMRVCVKLASTSIDDRREISVKVENCEYFETAGIAPSIDDHTLT